MKHSAGESSKSRAQLLHEIALALKIYWPFELVQFESVAEMRSHIATQFGYPVPDFRRNSNGEKLSQLMVLELTRQWVASGCENTTPQAKNKAKARLINLDKLSEWQSRDEQLCKLFGVNANSVRRGQQTRAAKHFGVSREAIRRAQQKQQKQM